MSTEQKERDWLDIESWCGRPRSVLDIGSGSAEIHRYLVPALEVEEVHLMDGGSARRSQMGWNPGGTKAWRDVNDGVKRVQAMDMECQVYGHKAKVDLTVNVDLIISIKSWGFHYPVDVYLPLAKRSLKHGGRIILDLRKNMGQIEAMSKFFHLFELDVGRSNKCFRSVWKR